MKCLSFNCRGMASASKKLALQRLFENESVDIIMLHETLGNAESIYQTLTAINQVGFSSLWKLWLDQGRDKILKEREETWKLKSRAIWLHVGDENTNFYQNYAKNLFRSPQEANLADVIQVAGHFPRYVGEEEALELNSPVTLEELEGTLKWFKKDKRPGPDGWTIEFYLAFYDLLAQDLLQVMEECRSSRKLYNAINSTFIALIPKSDSPTSFNDFYPISLYNCLYKIISKIIANRIRPIPYHYILPEQFAFLEDRQIHKAMGTTQEAIHSI
eukprot:PITA_01820